MHAKITYPLQYRGASFFCCFSLLFQLECYFTLTVAPSVVRQCVIYFGLFSSSVLVSNRWMGCGGGEGGEGVGGDGEEEKEEGERSMGEGEGAIIAVV